MAIHTDPISQRTDPSTSAHGCLSFLAAIVLFAAQRFLLFTIPSRSILRGEAGAYSLQTFIFGQPPFSVLDILLGFAFPEESLLAMLQPRSWMLGAVQGLHFGANLAIVFFLGWLISTTRAATGLRRTLGGLVLLLLCLCSVGIGVLIRLGIKQSSLDPSIRSRFSLDSVYSSEEYGFHFGYPEFLDLQAETQQDRGSAGEIVTLVVISAYSKNPFVTLIIRSIEDPLRDQLWPELYPPSETTYQLWIQGDLLDLDFDDSPEKREAMVTAGASASIRDISSYEGALYTANLSSSVYGSMYIHGAIVATDRRDISIMMIVSDESGVPGSLDPAVADLFWEEFVDTMQIDF